MNALAEIVGTVWKSAKALDPVLDLESWIRRNRLEPLVHGIEIPELKLSDAFASECRQAYLNMIGRAQYFTQESERLVLLLDSQGIPCSVWRGIDYGRRLYGDEALRYFADLDLLVTPEKRIVALKVMQDAGYRLRSRLIPRWFLSRHHHHWPLISSDGRVPLEVHWAVDNPYRDMGLHHLVTGPLDDTARIILACLHAEKESRLRYCMSIESLDRQLLLEEPLLPWLDLAVMIRQADPATIRQLADTAGSGPLEEVIHRSMWIVRRHFGVAMPDFPDTAPVFDNGLRNRIHARIRKNFFARKLAGMLNCRPDVLLDWVDFLVARPDQPPTGFVSRFLSVMKRSGKVLVLFVDGVACGLWILIQKMRRRNPLWAVAS